LTFKEEKRRCKEKHDHPRKGSQEDRERSEVSLKRKIFLESPNEKPAILKAESTGKEGIWGLPCQEEKGRPTGLQVGANKARGKGDPANRTERVKEAPPSSGDRLEGASGGPRPAGKESTGRETPYIGQQLELKEAYQTQQRGV